MKNAYRRAAPIVGQSGLRLLAVWPMTILGTAGMGSAIERLHKWASQGFRTPGGPAHDHSRHCLNGVGHAPCRDRFVYTKPSAGGVLRLFLSRNRTPSMRVKFTSSHG